MKILVQQLPDISEYSECIAPFQLSSDVSLTIVLKQMYRSDDVLIDIYLNEISEDTKILSGKKLTVDSLVCPAHFDKGLEYRIDCLDIDGVGLPLLKSNVSKFYLQYTKDD